MTKEQKLTVKQKIFCERYAANGGNGTEAATFAGYKKPDVQASQNLRKLSVLDYIKSLNRHAENIRILTAIEIKQFWTDMILGKHDDAKASDRIKASELLAKSGAMFVDNINHSGRIETNKNIEEIEREIAEINKRLSNG